MVDEDKTLLEALETVLYPEQKDSEDKDGCDIRLTHQ